MILIHSNRKGKYRMLLFEAYPKSDHEYQCRLNPWPKTSTPLAAINSHHLAKVLGLDGYQGFEHCSHDSRIPYLSPPSGSLVMPEGRVVPPNPGCHRGNWRFNKFGVPGHLEMYLVILMVIRILVCKRANIPIFLSRWAVEYDVLRPIKGAWAVAKHLITKGTSCCWCSCFATSDREMIPTKTAESYGKTKPLLSRDSNQGE